MLRFYPKALGVFVWLTAFSLTLSAQTDSDQDGLSDAVETGTGIYRSLDDTGTDPLDPDTDNDGFNDGVEVYDSRRMISWGSMATSGGGPWFMPPEDVMGVLRIKAGRVLVIAQRKDGKLLSWGGGPYDDGRASGVNGFEGAISFAAGGPSLVLTASGGVLGWGPSFRWQVPIPASLPPIVSVSSGEYHCAGVTAEGHVYEWGEDFTVPYLAPVTNYFRVLPKPVTEVSCGQFHTLALNTDGTVSAWGQNSSGQTNVPPGLSGVIQVVAGSRHSLALKSDGTVVAWGSNVAGEATVPPGLSNVVQLSAKGNASIARKSDGTLVHWGLKEWEQPGKTRVRPEPESLTNILDVSHGWEFVAAIRGRNPNVADSDFDSDGDGLADELELTSFNTAPFVADTDGDGISDGDEDTDGDGMPDGWELDHGFNPLDPADGQLDADGDQLLNAEEFSNGTNPRAFDSDGDELSDGMEVEPLGTNPLRFDTDGDGLGDGDEVQVHTTDPLNVDTDGDGMPDGWELDHGFNPLDPADGQLDADGDQLLNAEEFSNGTNPHFFDYFLYNVLQDGSLRLISYRFPGDTLLHVPDTIDEKAVSQIAPGAFQNLINLESVTIDEGITSIGDYAFAWSANLSTVTLPSTLTSIGSYAFAGCSNLATINWPQGITTIPEGVFSGSGLTTFSIPAAVTSIGSSAFANCSGLTSLSIPDGVTSIGSYAFGGTGLTSIVLPGSLEYIGDNWWGGVWWWPVGGWQSVQAAYGLGDCPSLTSITISEGTKGINAGALANLKYLTSIVIAGSVTSIGNGAFYGAGSYASWWGGGMGPSCTLSVLPTTGDPYSSINFGDSAFAGSGITEATISRNSVNFGNAAFSSSWRLTTLTVPSTSSLDFGAFSFASCSSLTTIGSPAYIYRVGNGAFQNSGLTSISLPGISTIGEYAFSGATNLARVEVGGGSSYWGSVVSIGGHAFANCASLSEVVFPTIGVPGVSVGSFAFANCTSLTNISFPNRPEGWGGWPWWGAGDYPHINSQAFDGCTNLANVTIGSSIASVSWNTFSNCPNLTAATLSMDYIDGFRELPGLANVRILRGIVNYNAFYGCTNLSSVTLDEGVTSIGGQAFGNCPKLTTITIPASVAYVLDYYSGHPFQGSTNLASINVAADNPNYFDEGGVLYSGTRTSPGTVVAYPPAKAGNSLNLPQGLSTISSGAFDSVRYLETVTIPTSVAFIGYRAFASSSVIGIYFEGDAPGFSLPPFENMLPEAKVYCYATSNGFESSTWNGLPVVVMNPGTTSVRSWLQNVGLHPSISLASDPGQRGVALLEAYAFNMDPLSRHAAQLPRAEVSGPAMSMRFYASSPGVNYVVETSDDLSIWSTNNVTVSPLDDTGHATATMPMNSGRRFMRINLTGPQ